MKPLRSNPGGVLPIQAIVGRDDLVRDAWEILEGQSILMTAERRIGKTQVLRKMQADAPSGWTSILTDLEKVHTAADFANEVFRHVDRHLSAGKKIANRTRKFLQDIGGTSVGDVLTLPQAAWKPFLIHCVTDLVNEQGDKKLAFFWDEMPYMLASIQQRDGEGAAMEVLDVLRSLRQEHPNFRMVLTGSIGLHHVIHKLKDLGYQNSPVNDMATIEVPPLEDEHAQELAAALLKGEGLQSPNLVDAAKAIARQADRVPYYIHHIVRHLRQNRAIVTAETVDTAVLNQLLNANDPWELAHYRSRIATYYPQSEPIVVSILDTITTASGPLNVDQILQQVSSQVEGFNNRNTLLDLLKLMDRDHYLERDVAGYRMRFPLIGRWWRLDRQLTDETA